VWKDERVPSCVMATPLSKDRWLYAVDRNQGLVCVEWETGKLLWADENRLTPKERNPHASMVWAGEDRAVSLNALGELVLTRLRPEGFEDQGRVSIIGKTWAHPAFSGQEVYARSDTEIVCVRVSDGS
jgi:outer membrane protein assembly factor BamB